MQVLKRFWKKPSQKLELLGNPCWRHPEVGTSGVSALETPRNWNFLGFSLWRCPEIGLSGAFYSGGAQESDFLGVSAEDGSRSWSFWGVALYNGI